MARPKDSKHSNRYKGNLLMIEKIANCVDQANAPRERMREHGKESAAQLKRMRKQQRRLQNA